MNETFPLIFTALGQRERRDDEDRLPHFRLYVDTVPCITVSSVSQRSFPTC